MAASPSPRAAIFARVETPAVVVDERTIRQALERGAQLRAIAGCRLLYALKPLVAPFVLELMRPHVDGFATSSYFEARLARSVLGSAGAVHITTPGFRASEMPEIDALCDHVAFNSIGQVRRLASSLGDERKVGLRINPELPLVDDDRYNPCRPQSKLGTPLSELRAQIRRGADALNGIRGVLLHTNCDSSDYAPLLRTVQHIEAPLRDWLPQLDWINLGGGYLLDRSASLEPLAEAVDLLRSRYEVEVFVEPGAALVREAGVLVAEVIDLFRSGGRMVAVLDTTVNHMPEVFEYQFEPDILGEDAEGDHEYILAGCTCLAGDVFGLYGFAEPLDVGSRIVFTGVGAYTTVKSHMFNGVNLPTVYSVSEGGDLRLRRRYTYSDFASRCETWNDPIV